MSGGLQAKSYINSGEATVTLIPQVEGNKPYARAMVTASGLGRIVSGNKAIIRLDAWPYKQFGSIVSHIDHISILSTKDGESANSFELTIPLQDPLLTNTSYSIPNKPEQSGMVRIITRDRSILTRLFDQIIQLTSND